MRTLLPLLSIVVAGILLAGCQPARDAYAVTTDDHLIRFKTDNAKTIDADLAITGLNSGETLLQIDFRPANKTLYGITSGNRVVTVDTGTGALTQVGSRPFTTARLGPPVVMDVNPAFDYLRVIDYQPSSGTTTNTSTSNLRVSPTDPTQVTTDGNGTLVYRQGDANEGQTPQLVAIAHINNKSDATSTTLYGLDLTTQSLVSIATGTLTTVGALDRGFTASAGFDIVPNNDQAFVAIADRNGSARLYTFNLSSGTTSGGTDIGSGRQIRSLAVVLDQPKRSGFGG